MTDTRKEYQDWLDKCPLTLFGGEFQVSEISWQACQQLNNTRIADLEATIRNMAAVIAKKDAALKFYADLGKYDDQVCCGLAQWSGNPNEPPECCGLPVNSIAVDNGKLAQEALALTADGVELVEVDPADYDAMYMLSEGIKLYTIKQKP